jgi:hypothetical protein
MKKKKLTLVERFKSESSELGKWFTLKIPVLLALSAGAVEVLEYTHALPDGMIPESIKQALLGLVLVAKLLGHATVKKTEDTEND